MARRDGERRLRSFVRIVPHALEALTSLEVLIIRLVMLGLMFYGLWRLITVH